MKNASLALLCALLIAVASCSGPGTTPGADGPRDTTDLQQEANYARYVIVLQPEATIEQRDELMAQLTKAPTHVYSHVYLGWAGEMTGSEFKQLANNTLVRLAELDKECHVLGSVDSIGLPLFVEPGSAVYKRALAGSQVSDWGVVRTYSDQNTGRGAGVTVAVLDTGCDLSHPDLVGAYHMQNGRPVSYNAIYPARTADDVHGHGTHCAGIIGARDNLYGTMGVAPDCKIIAVKVLSDTGSGAFSWMIAGIDWAVANKATYNIKVCSLSLGAGGSYLPGELAVDNATAAGLTMSIAAGNNNSDAANFTPARAATALTVGSVQGGTIGNPWGAISKSGFSNWGTTIEIVAPGSGIYATYRKGSYATLSGTSMACPHVSGACALWFDDHPLDARNEVLTALQSTGEAPNPGPNWPNTVNPQIFSADLMISNTL